MWLRVKGIYEVEYEMVSRDLLAECRVALRVRQGLTTLVPFGLRVVEDKVALFFDL